ncbi:MAG: ImmA/IrrE family metallo-endopeptidase [Dehalococcoidales bacterium]|nr:ImmA/IrrE family metallo-endopeptidase [Dehalococcoidales bacterium]
MLTLEGCRDGHCERPCELLRRVEGQASYFLDKAGISHPPVPLDLIHSFDPIRPVEVRFLPLRAHHGAVWLLGEEWVLHLNDSQPLPMKRYVAFHEGYHIVCHVSALYERESGDGCRPFTEATADFFAASLLMPRQWVLAYWPEVHSVAKMAEIFQAPEPAMRSWIRRWVEHQ